MHNQTFISAFMNGLFELRRVYRRRFFNLTYLEKDLSSMIQFRNAILQFIQFLT